MIKLVPVMDDNNIMADVDFHKNLSFLEKIMDSLYHFAKVVQGGDALIGLTSFGEAITELGGYEDFVNKNVYVITNKTKAELQAMHPEGPLSENIRVIQDGKTLLLQYQGQNKPTLFVGGGAKTLNQLAPYSDEIILLRHHINRTQGIKFNAHVLNYFTLVQKNKQKTFEVEIYTKNVE